MKAPKQIKNNAEHKNLTREPEMSPPHNRQQKSGNVISIRQKKKEWNHKERNPQTGTRGGPNARQKARITTLVFSSRGEMNPSITFQNHPRPAERGEKNIDESFVRPMFERKLTDMAQFYICVFSGIHPSDSMRAQIRAMLRQSSMPEWCLPRNSIPSRCSICVIPAALVL